MTFDPIPFEFLPALKHWAAAFGSFVLVVLVVVTGVCTALFGTSGPRLVGRALCTGAIDFARLSPRRVYALAQLTFREAIRRKALLVFAVFAALFMLAGWFLSEAGERTEDQVKVYVSFVLTTISWLSFAVILLLSCWGLPEDIRLRSLHTVVTKPARRNEIVIGRMLGFIGIGTLIVAVMGLIGYVWIQRQVPPDVPLFCRVPVYGTLTFLDREGRPAKRGINTGDIWEFRSYIEGATKARAIWRFPITQQNDELILESRFEAFRTHKGKIGQTLQCKFELVNPETGVLVELPTFQVREFHNNLHRIPRTLTYTDPKTRQVRELDLYDDLVHEGTLEVRARCLDVGQFIGMARPDLFIRLPNRSFAAGFSKAVLGVWLVMVLIVLLGVTASCFVKGPVATLLTFTFLLVGQGFRDLLDRIVSHEQLGGGPLESIYRLVTHLNEQVPLPEGPQFRLVQGIDSIFNNCLWLVQHIVPDLRPFRMSPYVANGFDVPWSAALAPSLAIVAAYVVPCLLIGYFALTYRELEAK